MTFTNADINNIETDSDIVDPVDYYTSIQRAINAGMWTMQGSYGRAMMEAINDGKCLLGLKATKDYWGNTIPSRLQVKDGTKGSWEYVKQKSGDDWATDMAGVDIPK
jgi:hypothetical protein